MVLDRPVSIDWILYMVGVSLLEYATANNKIFFKTFGYFDNDRPTMCKIIGENRLKPW